MTSRRPVLTLVHSNRLARLADALIDRLEESASSPLDPDVVVVPSRGMARWLQYRIADRHGVCTQVEFPFAAQFVWRLLARVLPEVPEASPFDPATLAWRLHGLLGALPGDPALAPLAAYVERNDERARFELARRLAALFDQYLVYRPDWLQRWAEGRTAVGEDARTDAWQGWLWRRVLADLNLPFAAHPRDIFLDMLARLDAAQVRALLPARIALFAPPLLPPLYLEAFAGLARHMDVDVYVLNPCREFWADIVAEKDIARLALAGLADATLHESGHALLASWGKQARDHLALLAAVTGEEGVQDRECFVAPGGDTLLARLQRSILDLDDASPLALAQKDASLQIHACHSLTRQLEVLHDRLLHLFETADNLRPADIVVLLPDIDAAAPLIEAVFASVPRTRHIPFVITGRARPDATPLLAAFDALLALPGSRFAAPALLDLLQTPALARRYGLDDADLEQVREWLRAAGVRWGRDASHREALGLPAEARHTWADGLMRLLLGYALAEDEAMVFADVRACTDIEGSGALPLGRLARFVADLAATARDLTRPRSLAHWSRDLAALVRRFFEPDQAEADEAERLRAAIADFADPRIGTPIPVGVEALREALAQALAAGAPGAVPAGAVTFCGIGALRGLPYRVVCLLGLDDGAFPRVPSPLEFDLMALKPRLGDRARRDDDRGLFLDALLAARDVFYLSYSGRSQRDNSLLPPSVLVQELIDHLARRVRGGREALEQALVTQHALQPFSRRYFNGELFSYAQEQAAVAAALAHGARAPAAPLFDAPLPPAGEEWRRLGLDTLQRFLRHPTRFLLRERLRIALEAGDEEVPGAEPFTLDGLEGWRLSDRLLRLKRSGADQAALAAAARAGTELPHGRSGAAALATRLQDVETFAALLDRVEPRDRIEPLPFEIPLGPYTLTGTLRGLGPDGVFGYRLTQRSADDVLSAWLTHLVLNLCAPPGVERRTRWLNKDVLAELPPIVDAPARLAQLLDLYWRGLHAPLPFFARTAMALVFESEGKARAAWLGNDARAGDAQDHWCRLVYGDACEAPPEDFAAIAEIVLGPYRDLRRDVDTKEAL